MSHPTWVRGLKHVVMHITIELLMSHPTWVRGLKLDLVKQTTKESFVAPYVGAWIETFQ